MPHPKLPPSYRVGALKIPLRQTVIMGVVNVTPDSFSDGGRFLDSGRAVEQGLRLIDEGAGVVDVGGESSRPGADPVTAEEEKARVIPVIQQIVRQSPATPVSIDTCKPEVARAAIEEGAVMINDITGFSNPAMVELAASTKVVAAVMHMKGTPRTMQKRPAYTDVVREIAAFLKAQAKKLEKQGVTKIYLDPGVGFGKTVNHNLTILNNLPVFVKLGYPVMIGASRKSFLGAILDLPADQREEGTLAVTALAAHEGVSLIRVHDVASNLRAAQVSMSVRAGKPVRPKS